MKAPDIPRELLLGFLEEAEESLAGVEPLLVKLEAGADRDTMDRIFRPIHSMKGNAAYFGLMRVKDLSHRMESILDLLRQGLRRMDRETLNGLLRGLDALRTLFQRAREELPQEARPGEFDLLSRDLEILAQRSSGPPPPAEEESQFESSFPLSEVEAPPSESTTPKRRERKSARTMRIPETSMDRFLELIGELMGLEEQLRYLGKRLGSGTQAEIVAGDLRHAVEQFGHLSTKLSGSVLDLRRIEAKPLLQKVPRLCSDIAGLTGKTIEAEIEGEEVRIDKSYLELLDAPLVHMVRNSCDHGLEPAKERLALGKPAAGKVKVRLRELDESVVLEISDDGQGLNLPLLRKKAIELGMAREEAPFTEAEALQVIFRPGVSTAERITDISGRGVGMDVVKKEIEGAGGRIEARNSPGRGCTFVVSLPRSVTTRITDGLLFRCGAERFVVPMRLVIETFTVDSALVSNLPEGGQTVCMRGKILRLVQPEQLLDSPCSPDAAGVLIRIRARESEFVLRVEEVLGVQRTVVKPLDDSCRAGGLFAGAALVGDGGLALVTSEDGIAQWLQSGR